MANYDAIDCQFTFNGDYTIGQEGDLSDTAQDQVQSLIQQIQSIVNSELGDWEENSNYAASLSDFIGEPNNRDTANQITNRIRTALITNNIVSANDLDIKVVPIGISKVMVIIKVLAASTPNNSIIEGGTAIVTVIFDYIERGIFFLDKDQLP